MRIAMIGFGEAARAFLSGWTEAGVRPAAVAAYDVKLDRPGEADAMAAAMADAGVAVARDPAQALAGADAAFCLVTADQAEAAARAGAPFLRPGTLWFDGNSCSPGAKRRAADAVAAGGGAYVDVAIMAPVHPPRHTVPLLVAGPAAADAAARLRDLDMRPAIAGPAVGDASTVKMLRSVMVKGLEALTAECVLAARRAGVEDAVLASLQASDPGFDWRERAAYNLERMMVHGRRRAAEMREVAVTVAELGLPDAMASAIAGWQETIGRLGLAGGADDLGERADRVLGALDAP